MTYEKIIENLNKYSRLYNVAKHNHFAVKDCYPKSENALKHLKKREMKRRKVIRFLRDRISILKKQKKTLKYYFHDDDNFLTFLGVYLDKVHVDSELPLDLDEACLKIHDRLLIRL